MDVCIIELVSFRVGLGWKDDFIKGVLVFYWRRIVFSIFDILNGYGYWRSNYKNKLVDGDC